MGEGVVYDGECAAGAQFADDCGADARAGAAYDGDFASEGLVGHDGDGIEVLAGCVEEGC